MDDPVSPPAYVCARCRYDMSGTPWTDDGVTCPECGTRFSKTAQLKPKSEIGWGLMILAILAPWVIGPVVAIAAASAAEFASLFVMCVFPVPTLLSLLIAAGLSDSFRPVAGQPVGRQIGVVLGLWLVVNAVVIGLMLVVGRIA